MEFLVKHSKPANQHSACIVLGIYHSRKLSGIAREVDELTGGAIRARLRSGDLTGELSQTITLYEPAGLPCQRLLLVGCGKQQRLDLTAFRKHCATVARALRANGARDAALWSLDLQVKDADLAIKVRHLVEVMGDSWYRYSETKSKPQPDHKLERVTLNLTAAAEVDAANRGLRRGAAISIGKKAARDLANLPGNICTPSYLARQALELQERYKIKTTVLEKKQMKRLGMGALLSVARGSREEPKLIIMEYRGGDQGAAPVALVGKGLTFDAGGISIKPAANMDEMKYDMCGGASVFGALVAAAELALPLNLVGIVPSSENLPDGAANKPGDIVTTMSGQTVEILNTDAEGRLILCDALTYAEKFKPELVIDIATLTGACVVALGSHASGLFSNDDELAAQLLTAGENSRDRSWRLPLWEDYQSQLDSNFADMANVGGRNAGAVTAACFLARYTKNFRWAHLDIAGTAWRSGKDKGATGRPVPMLVQFLMDRCDTPLS